MGRNVTVNKRESRTGEGGKRDAGEGSTIRCILVIPLVIRGKEQEEGEKVFSGGRKKNNPKMLKNTRQRKAPLGSKYAKNVGGGKKEGRGKIHNYAY